MNKVYIIKRMGFFATLRMTIVVIVSFFSLTTSYAQFVKFEETFDTGNIQSRGWLEVNNDSSFVVPQIRSAFTFLNLGYQNAYDGNNFYLFNFDNANPKNVIDDWLVTPYLTNIESGDTMSFWCGSIDGEFKDTIRVLISTTNNNLSSFVEIDQFKVNGSAGVWHKKSYDLSAYSGQNIYFAVNYSLQNGGALGTSSDYVWIDYFLLTSKYSTSLPETYELAQNFPNPFNPGTEITFSLPEASNVSLKVYDVTGKEVSVLANGFHQRGRYHVTFNGNNFASGIYFYKLVTPKFTHTKKMVLKK
ncbi:MAG TPA: choice-of-anchor J domain-containing protein [Ignavibacteria bacterium]|nr:choice-of-anchor J domain-containing protein [Ignavibacteria bacterium]